MDNPGLIYNNSTTDLTTKQPECSGCNHVHDKDDEVFSSTDEVGDQESSSHLHKVLHISLVIILLSIFTLFIIALTHIIIKRRRRRTNQSSRLEETNSKLNVSITDIPSKNKNLLLIQLEPETMTKSSTSNRKTEIPRKPPELPKRAAKNTPSNHCEQQSTKNFVIGCSDKPDDFLTSLSSPKRNYEELLDLLLSQKSKEFQSLGSITISTQAQLCCTNQSTLRSNAEIENKSEPKQTNVCHNSPDISRKNTVAGQYDERSPNNLNEPSVIQSTIRTSTVAICSDSTTTEDTTQTEPHIFTVPIPSPPRHLNLPRPPHEYDPVYVPRHDSIGVLRRIDNETSYITNRKLLNNMGLITNFNNSNDVDNNLNNDQVTSNIPVATLQPHSSTLHPAFQPPASQAHPVPTSASTFPPAIPPRISSKHSNDANISNLTNNIIPQHILHLPSNVSYIHGNRDNSRTGNDIHGIGAPYNSQRSSKSSNPYETIDEL